MAGDLSGWRPPPGPGRPVLAGRHVRLEPLDPSRHGADLIAAMAAAPEVFGYLPYGPFPDAAAHRAWLEQAAQRDDVVFLSLVPTGGGAAGLASYLRIDPAAGSIEVGHICLTPALQRSPAATEAMVLMMGHAFALGYRRYEWKCDAANLPSRRAAQRLGFSFEGVFRQAAVVKGRNRDTAWYAVIDGEWPALRVAFDRWLDADNFDSAGRQRQALSDLTRPLLAARDPVLPG
ncbi:MAG: GNAT family N-acetyltransferase [Paracoccaceae bacterium]|nr:MAG: GNAT family N-acetyltransferase [Paracoccaceae bacterium]